VGFRWRPPAQRIIAARKKRGVNTHPDRPQSIADRHNANSGQTALKRPTDGLRSGLRPSESQIDRAPDGGIALAHHFLQFLAIQYLDDGATIFDCAGVAQTRGGSGDARPAHSENFGERLLTELDVIVAAIRRQQ